MGSEGGHGRKQQTEGIYRYLLREIQERSGGPKGDAAIVKTIAGYPEDRSSQDT